MFLDDLKGSDPAAALAIPRTLSLEGGLVDSPADPGGVTDHGVSLRFALAEVKVHPEELPMFDIDHAGQVDRPDIVGLTQDEAARIYYECFWKRYGYGQLRPWMVAWKAFDICVNTGPKQAATILQQAMADVGQPVTVDGRLGLATVAAANACGNLPLLSAMRVRQAAFYTDLIARKPSLQPFAAGWARRAAA